MNKITQTNHDLIVEKIKIYNELNRDLNRYVIFNDFIIIWKTQAETLVLDMYPSDEVGDDWETLFDNSFILDLNNQAEVDWTLLLIKNLIKNAEKKLTQAKELARPNSGILIYDSATNAYFLNPTTAGVILKSKNAKKTIIWTRLEMFGLFINLRSILLSAQFFDEIKELSNKEIWQLCQELVKDADLIHQKTKRFEFIPEYLVKYEVQGDTITLVATLFKTRMNNGSIERKISFTNTFTANLHNKEELFEVYNIIKRGNFVSDALAELKHNLTHNKEPQLFELDANGDMITTEIGAKVYENLNLLEFLNKDITETIFEI